MTALEVGVDYRDLRPYKYRTLRALTVETGYRPASILETGGGLVRLERDGELLVRPGYVWDGPSGPTFDTPGTLRASLFHDALYQLMREELLDDEVARARADDVLRRLLLEDGVGRFRAAYWLWGVRTFAARAARS